MKGITNLSLITIFILILILTAGAVINVPAQVDKPITGTQSALAISYPEGPTLSVKFKGTERLPKSSGEAKVQRKKGMTEIEIELDEMKPAAYFGGDYATYVLWVVSPEGHTDNVGEFILQGNRSKLNVSTPLETFGLFVTAEPHFLVDVPSRFVVMENTRPTNHLTGQMLEMANIKYHGFDGIYQASQTTLVGEPEAKGETRSDVRQAKVSLLLAERAGAQQFAADEYAKAYESWKKTAEAAEARVDKKILMTYGHETVRLAVAAEKRAKEVAFQTALNNERKSRNDEIEALKVSIDKAQSDAERAELQAKQKEMELAMEVAARSAALKQAEESARRAAEAEEKARLAQQQAGMLANEKLKAQMDADQAQKERDAARTKMREALNQVVETRETARGLIVNLPDILFDFNKDQLKPEAREKLSKVCGILSVTGGYNLSIEGHTDNKGTDDYNQKLSARRAQNVTSYLSTCGLNQSHLSSRGFGKTQPIATNDTAEGRQQNRRVEIVISDMNTASAVQRSNDQQK
ncbi:MAG: OmpA family protein [Acidobacteria bacterium]|nr:OmpA family protein [Acidobacteriota bacterium]